MEKEEWLRMKRKEIKEEKEEKECLIKKTLELINEHRKKSANEAYLRWVRGVWWVCGWMSGCMSKWMIGWMNA